MAAILVVDDKETIRSSLASILRREGHKVLLAGGTKEAVDLLGSRPIDVVLTDLRMEEKESGLAVVDAARRVPRRPVTIVMTAYGTVSSAVEAMKLGADDYLEKPLKRKDLLDKIEAGMSKLKSGSATEPTPGNHGLKDIIAVSPSMQELVSHAKRLALVSSPILIVGESGTGKSLLARAIHFESSRARNPFVVLDGAALHAEAFEDHAASVDVAGDVSAHNGTMRSPLSSAAGGTVYIKGPEHMSPAIQNILLNAIRDPQAYGDVRVILGTSEDMSRAVTEGRFRSDLLYSCATLEIPPLKDHAEDIQHLAKHFVKQFAPKGAAPPPRLVKDARRCLVAHPFPGNVRELRNLMEQSVLLAQNGEIGPDLLRRFGLRVDLEPASGEVFRGTIANAEREAIQRVLTKHPRNLLGAAQELGISRTTLWRKMKKFGMIQRGRKAAQFGEEILAIPGAPVAEVDNDDFDVNDFDVQEDTGPARPVTDTDSDPEADTESEREAGM